MFTILLALIHSQAKNQKFNPTDLYFACFVLDFILILISAFALSGK